MNKPKHTKYPSITNHYDSKVIHKIHALNIPSWVVTEKVHGANFQIIGIRDDALNIDYHYCSRTQHTTTEFFGLEHSKDFNQTLEKIKELILDIFSEHYTEDTIIVRVFGEAYGGNIQKGIFYKDIKDFVVFDIMVEYQEKPSVYLSYSEMSYLCKTREVPFTKPLLVSSFEECLSYPNTFNSTYSSIEDNICEGVVIRPYSVDSYLSSGSRVIIKSKNDKWSEKVHARKENSYPKVLLTEELQMAEELRKYLNVNRYEAAISKYGREMKSIPDLMVEVWNDITIESGVQPTKDVRKALGKEILNGLKSCIINT